MSRRKVYHRGTAETIARRRERVRFLWLTGNKPRAILRALRAESPELLVGAGNPYALVWEDVSLARRQQVVDFAKLLAAEAGPSLRALLAP